MKRISSFVFAAVFLTSCNNETGTKTFANVDAVSSEKIDYAYMPENHPPDNWDRGDQKKVAIALKCLKGYENKNIEQAMAPFADSVRWSADGVDAKFSKDSLKAIFLSDWKKGGIKVVMSDYEAVISKDKKEEYVTLWYKQIMTDATGKADSVAVVDDLKFVDGKITELDEKTRKYPSKK